MLEWDAFTTLFQKITEGCENFLIKRPVELGVEAHAIKTEHMGKQMLHIPAGISHAALFQVLRTSIDRFQDGLHRHAAYGA